MAVHRYPATKDQDPEKPHPGFGSRSAEVRALFDIIGSRRFLVSESGFHTAPWRHWWFWRRQLTPYDQWNYLREDMEFWRIKGADAWVCYQERDEPGSKGQKFGLTEPDGTWKTPGGYSWGVAW